MIEDKMTRCLGYAMAAMFTWMGVVDLVRGKWLPGVLFLVAVAICVAGLWLHNRRSS